MFLRTFCKRIRHLYFNYHFDENSSRWINSNFTRHLQFAIRMFLSFLIASFLTYGPATSGHFSLQFMIPNLAVVILQETFGLTLSITIQITILIIPLSIIFYLLQLLRIIYHHYLLNEFLFLLFCFIISYLCTQIATKKLGLVFICIFFTTIANGNQVPELFAFGLLEIFVIGMGIPLVSSLCIFPLFATIDIENRINYCLFNLQKMSNLIIEAFLCEDQMSANVFLSRVKIIEKMTRKAMITIQSRFLEINYEPSKVIQKIFNRKRNKIFNCTLQEQDDLASLLMLNICSLELVVQQCKLNQYHTEFITEVKPSLLNFCINQSSLISCLMSYSSITHDQLLNHLTNLQSSFESVRSSYIQTRLHRIEQTFQSTRSIQLEDHLSHTFFIFQLNSIVQLFTNSIITKEKLLIKPKKKSYKDYFKIDWSRFLSALKTTILMGIGSIFVIIPSTAAKFENGLWILVTLCMSQGISVGGAFTIMKMRLIGTLLGSMWGYITYLVAGDHVYYTILMLSPWMFFFGYMKLYPQWGNIVIVATSTPIIVNFGRLPFGDVLPEGNYVLLRIQQTFIGIAIALGITIVIFPVFAIDLLKENIQSTLELCQKNVKSIVFIYNQLFHHETTEENLIIDFSNLDEIKNYIDTNRRSFHQLISTQRTSVDFAIVEPSFCCLNSSFSSSHYNLLVQQQIDMYRMFHNINSSLVRINEYSNLDLTESIHAINGLFLPDLFHELENLSKQLNDCLKLWSIFFNLTQTKFHQIYRGSFHHRKHLIQNDVHQYEKCLNELDQTIHFLQNQHQQISNKVLNHYFQRFSSGESLENLIPYVKNDQADSLFIAISAMYYSITQLATTALALGTTIHELFELEITNLYRAF